MIKDVFIMLASIIALVIAAIFAFFCVMSLGSCTISLQNVSTNGGSSTLSDVQTTDPDVKSDLTIPTIP